MMDWSNDGSWMSGWGMAFMLIFWVAVIGLVVWAVLRTNGQGRMDGAYESPRQILDRRFAAGELTGAEYSAAIGLMEGTTYGTSPSG